MGVGIIYWVGWDVENSCSIYYEIDRHGTIGAHSLSAFVEIAKYATRGAIDG